MWWIEALIIFILGAVVGGYVVYNHYFPKLGQFQEDLRLVRKEYIELAARFDAPIVIPAKQRPPAKRLIKRRANVGRKEQLDVGDGRIPEGTDTPIGG